MSLPRAARFGAGKELLLLSALSGLLFFGLNASATAEVCNVKVVTDGNPDYTDIGSMLYSITSRWDQPKDKCWALWYWNHIARRQTLPMHVHFRELTDPIRQFNDYGFTMCSTVAGVNCSTWGALGMNVKFWDISLHTVPEVYYDGRWHMYDSSLTALYTLCDGKTLAGVQDIGAEGACEASGGKSEPGHIAKYHCITATSRNGFLAGCDTIRALEEESKCFNPRGLKYRSQFNNWDLGHRYILNLRDNEVYTRYYHRLDENTPNGKEQDDKHTDFKADPAYYVPNEHTGKDSEGRNPRYHLRGNGLRDWTPALTAEGLAGNAYALTGMKAIAPAGLEPAAAGQPGEVVFKVEGANVMTSLGIKAALTRSHADDLAAIAVSTDNGLHWKEVWHADKTGELPVDLRLIEPVNSAYDVLVKISLTGKAAASDARLQSIAFHSITQVNSKTQPRLRLGKNTVCLQAGEQTDSIVVWPDLASKKYKDYVIEEKNTEHPEELKNSLVALCAEKGGEDAYIVFRVDAPSDITRVTYGGRFCAHGQKAHHAISHSFDGGKTWKQTYALTDITSPNDVIHYEKIDDVPAGSKSVLFKYLWEATNAGPAICGLYAVRMEVNHKAAKAVPSPMEVTYTWKERQADYTTVQRSHTQLVEKLPASYEINVGGADHPIMESLRINLQGALSKPAAYGYSDGKENADAKRFQDRWVTYGRNLAEGKPYTTTVPTHTDYGANDGGGKILTDGGVGPTFIGGVAYHSGVVWKRNEKPVVTVDLGKPEHCAAFRIQTSGYPFLDALKGEVKDKVEVQTSVDGTKYDSQGFFDFRLRWKDIPANDVWLDDETLKGANYLLVAAKPVEARYVRFVITPDRGTLSVSEVQVLDSVTYEPFDLKLALPDGKDRADITAYNPKHYPSTRLGGKGKSKEEGKEKKSKEEK